MKKLGGLLMFIFSTVLGISQNWTQVGQGAYVNISSITPPQTFCVDTTNNLLYSSGHFKTATGDTIFGVAVWDGLKWDSLSSGIEQGNVEELYIYNGEIYAIGGFNSAGNVSSNYLSKWNGLIWDTIPPNDMNNWGFGMYEYNSELHACGLFNNLDTTTSSRIASWNGNYWSTVGAPTWVLGEARTMIEYNSELFVGGTFDAPSPGILKWDGNNWFAVGGSTGFTQQVSLYSPIECFEVYQSNLYIGGYFQTPYPNSITYWDGTSYNPMGGGVDGVIFDMTVFNNELYVVGNFTTAGGILASNIAKWDGTKWCGFGTTFNGDVRSIEVFNNELYIGGNFTQVDGLPISGVAKWIGGSFVDTCGVVGVEENVIEDGISIYPNPASDVLYIDGDVEIIQVELFDITGKMIMRSSLATKQLDVGYLVRGVYLIRIKTWDGAITRKFVKE